MTTICLGFHEGVWVHTSPNNDADLYRCVCGDERVKFRDYFAPRPATLRWEAT